MDARRRAAQIGVLIALVVLALEGLELRRLTAEPYLWTGPRRTAQQRPRPAVSREAEAAGPWPRLLEELAKRPTTPALATVAAEGRAAVDGVGNAYLVLLEILTPEQRQALLRPSADLVDPLAPGITADHHPLYEFCVLALSSGAVTPAAEAPTPNGAWAKVDLPMPQHVFWGLTRAAVGSDSTLTPAQKGSLLAALELLSTRTRAYHDLRATLWTRLGLPLKGPERVAPPFPYPTAQELTKVGLALDRLTGSPRR